MGDIIPQEVIEKRIFSIRGQKVMLDADLAILYEVETKVLIQAVSRNIGRFPGDFMIQLSVQEFNSLRSQFVTSKRGRGGRRYLPYVFTEQGVAMLSSVLNSERAVQVNIAIMRAFVRLRRVISTNKKLAYKLSELEKRVGKHDGEIYAIFEAMRQLMEPPLVPPKPLIGFK